MWGPGTHRRATRPYSVELQTFVRTSTLSMPFKPPNDPLDSFATEMRGNVLAVDTAASSSAPTPDRISTLEYFTLFRQYRMREQELLNQRVTWSLAIQGLLFVAQGLCLSKLAELESGEYMADVTRATRSVAQLKDLLKVLPIAGLVLSAGVFLSIIGAMLSLNRLRKAWRDHVEGRLPLYVPSPEAAGSTAAVRLGLFAPSLIQAMFAGAWLYILLRARR